MDAEKKAAGNKIGPVTATFIVAGNMMGSGVFMLPANLAAYGSISIISWIITSLGAVALGLTFGRLACVYPAAGGPYAYARKAFGDYMGYQTNLVYWVANVVGNVGLAVTGIGYLTHFLPGLQDAWLAVAAQLLAIWLLTYANILGPRILGLVQSVATSIKLIPILGVAIFGWFWFRPELFAGSWNVSGHDELYAISGTLNLTLWAFVGVESAAVSTAIVREPRRNVPIATICGVLLAGFCYLLSSSALMGILPNAELAKSSAPFADAVRMALGEAAGNAVALCAAVGCLGSLGGWILMVSQSGLAAASDGLFGAAFARVNRQGVPTQGLVIVATLMSLMALLSMSPQANEQFGRLASTAVLLTLLPYIYSCIAIKVLGYGAMPRPQYLLYLTIGFAGAIFCLLALVCGEPSQTRWSLIFVIATIVLYSAAITRRRDMAEGSFRPGGLAAGWLRWLTLAVTICLLGALFVLTVY